MRMRCSLTGVLIVIAAVCLAQKADGRESNTQLFDWQQLPALPAAVEGAFVAVTDGVLVVAGGQHTEGKDLSTTQAFSDDIFVLKPGAHQWQVVGKLDEPLAYGSAVDTDFGMLCIGGRNAKRLSAHVFILRWNAMSETMQVTDSVDLPRPMAMLSAAKLRDKIYVVGGQTDRSHLQKPEKVFWALDASSLGGSNKSHWQTLLPRPGEACFAPVVVAQSGGLYVFGGSASYLTTEPQQLQKFLLHSYRYDPLTKDACKWCRVADLPLGIAAAPSLAYGTNTILAFGGFANRDSDSATSARETLTVASEILAYDTITDTWTARGKLPSPTAMTSAVQRQGHIIIPGGHTDMNRTSPDTLEATPISWQGSFCIIDYTVLAGYLLILVFMGWYFSGREKSAGDFLLGGHRIPWWAAGISILATQVSSIGFMAIPAKAFATDWVYFMGVLTWFIAVPIVSHYYIPFYRRLNVTTAYEYLEHRFNVFVRLYGSCAFITLQLGRMAIVLYLPALALSLVTGMDVYLSILVMGVLSTAYTVMGGIEAVVWTDVLQAGVLMGGAMLGAIIAIAGIDGGMGEFLAIAQSNDKFHMVNWDLDIMTATIWIVLVGNVFQRTADLTADQAVVQRYLTTRDERQSTRALWASVSASIPWAMTVFIFGTALFVFFKTHPERLNPLLQTDAIVPWFVMEEMPQGISGLVIAALFAAAMSSLDSSIHSVATTLTVDFYKRFCPNASDRSQLRLARWLTGLLGILGTAAALFAATYQIESLWDLFLRFAGLAVGGLAGLFMLGIFTKRANGIGAGVGAIASAVIMYTVQSYTPTHFFLYPVIGISSSFIVGYVTSVLLPVGAKPLKGLTVHTTTEKHVQRNVNGVK